MKSYEYFLSIVEHGSITKAAQTLYFSQSYLSQYLAKLERDLDAKLFYRINRRLNLTPAGEVYLDYVLKRKALDEQLNDTLEDITNSEYGKIVIGVPAWRGATSFHSVIQEFIKRYPHVEIELREGNTEFLNSLMDANRVDFSLINVLTYDSGYISEIITEERLLLAGRKDNPLFSEYPWDGVHPGHIDVEHLKSAKFITLHSGSNQTRITENLFSLHGIKINSAIKTGNPSSALNIASICDALTFVPETGISNVAAKDKLAFYAIGNPALSWTLSLLYPKETYISKSARYFMELLKEYYQSYRGYIDKYGLFFNPFFPFKEYLSLASAQISHNDEG